MTEELNAILVALASTGDILYDWQPLMMNLLKHKIVAVIDASNEKVSVTNNQLLYYSYKQLCRFAFITSQQRCEKLVMTEIITSIVVFLCFFLCTCMYCVVLCVIVLCFIVLCVASGGRL